MNNEIVILREAIKKIVPLIAGKGLKVTQIGTGAFVVPDPVTGLPSRVNIPNIPDNASKDFVQAIQGFIDHEVAHVLFTDFTFKAREKTPRLHNLHNIVEDTMIERLMAREFRGSGQNIRQLSEHFLANVSKPAIDAADSESEEFSYLLVILLRALAGHEPFQDFMDKYGYWNHPLVKAFMNAFPDASKKRMPLLANTRETYEIAAEIEQILYPPPPPAPPQPEPQEQDADDGEGGEGEDKDDSGESDDQDHSDEEQTGDGEGDGEREHTEDNDKASGGEEGEDEDQDGDAEQSENGEAKDDANDAEDDGDQGSDGSEKPEENDAGDDADGESDTKSEDGDSESEDDGDDEADSSAGEEDGDEDDQDNEGSDGAQESDGEGDGGEDQEEEAEGSGDDSADENTDDGEGESDEKDGLSDVALETESQDGDGSDQEDGEKDAKTAGVGYNGMNPFSELEKEDFSERDLSSSISVLIQREAIDAIREADYSVYTREYDFIGPLEIPDGFKDKMVTDLEESTQKMIGPMQKDIERMMASQARIFNVGGRRSGRLNGAGLHRLVANDPRVFSQREEIKGKDTAVSLLLDCSGSMSGEKMSTGMLASYALSSTLERVGISHEVIGFTTAWPYSYGPNKATISVDDWNTIVEGSQKEEQKHGIKFHRTIPLRMPIFKGYNERLSTDVKRRFAAQRSIQPGMGGNIDGESLEYAAIRLAQRPEKRKVIIVLSDGHPAGAINDKEHLKMMTEKLSKGGFDLVGIGIKDDAVRRFYDNHIVLNKIEELPGAVMRELRTILSK